MCQGLQESSVSTHTSVDAYVLIVDSSLPAVKPSAGLHITRAEKIPQNPRGYSIAKGIFRNQRGIKMQGCLDVFRTQLSLR